MVDPSYPDGIFFSDIGADAVYVDDLQDAMFILNGTSVQRWDAGAALSARFRSKVFDHLAPVPGFTCAKVIADTYPVALRVFADTGLVADVSVPSTEPVRLPSGFRTFTTQVEVETTGAVQGVSLAHSLEELRDG
jgi:hypothetical protein